MRKITRWILKRYKPAEAAQAGDVVLFHGCCHNPTGIDPTLEQWQVLAELSVEKGGCRFIRFRLRGFARGTEEDAEGLRAFAALHKTHCRQLLLQKLRHIMSASAPAPSLPPMRKPWIAL